MEKKVIIAEDGDVILRELNDSDLTKLVEYANNDEVSVNLRDAFPNPYTFTDAQNFKSMIDSQNSKTIFAIEYQENYVGNISLSLGKDVYRKSAEIGYLIGKPFWNKGIVTRAVNLMTDWGFEHLDIVRIYAGIFEFNKASQSVLEKCGYTREAVFRQAICKNNKIYDEIRYGKIKKS